MRPSSHAEVSLLRNLSILAESGPHPVPRQTRSRSWSPVQVMLQPSPQTQRRTISPDSWNFAAQPWGPAKTRRSSPTPHPRGSEKEPGRRGRLCSCGEGGIRTRGAVARTHDFQSCTFGHSVTSPGYLAGPARLLGHSCGSSDLLRPVAGPALGRPLEDLRRGRDSNPRWAVNPHLISNQAPSATRTPLRGGNWQDGPGLSRTGRRLASQRPRRGKTAGRRLGRPATPSHVVVRGLLGDDHVVHVALPQALSRHADELGVEPQGLDIA